MLKHRGKKSASSIPLLVPKSVVNSGKVYKIKVKISKTGTRVKTYNILIGQVRQVYINNNGT